MTSTVTAIPLLDLKSQYQSIRQEINSAIQRVLDSQYFIMGPEAVALEKEIADYSQTKFGIGVSSGTDALLVALMALDIGPGDEVITTPYSFFATAGAIARLGATPVFVDIDPLTYNIVPELIETRITDRSKVIIPVHLYGQMADMDPIMALAAEHGLTVIEDAAQAIGSEYKGKRAGSIGHMGCFSFFPSKNLGGYGDGGMVVTQDEQLAERIDILRKHGSSPKYYHKFVGGNFRLDAIQGAVLGVKLGYLDEWTAGRQENAALYRTKLRNAGLVAEADSIGCLQAGCQASGRSDGCNLQQNGTQIVLPEARPEMRHIYNQFIIRCPRRDELMAHLKSLQIGCEIYYPVPLHRQECFAYLGYEEGSLPNSECAALETLAIPVYPELTEPMMDIVVQAIASFYGK
ncbi:MAG: DegT/DnrJ/EryC1/StrS family aminotransferase [Chloroflexota bacterium]